MKPILFNTEMVRAILAGRKTQTRRPIKPQPDGDGSAPEPLTTRPGCWNAFGDDRVYRPKYLPGDILYVRETWAQIGNKCFYRADGEGQWVDDPVDGYSEGWNLIKWRPSIHMPREAARIFLRVTDVRVEPLWDISDSDLSREGVPDFSTPEQHRFYFADDIWDETIPCADLSRFGWAANPWVWVYTFERISREEAMAG